MGVYLFPCTKNRRTLAALAGVPERAVTDLENARIRLAFRRKGRAYYFVPWQRQLHTIPDYRFDLEGGRNGYLEMEERWFEWLYEEQADNQALHLAHSFEMRGFGRLRGADYVESVGCDQICGLFTEPAQIHNLLAEQFGGFSLYEERPVSYSPWPDGLFVRSKLTDSLTEIPYTDLGGLGWG